MKKNKITEIEGYGHVHRTQDAVGRAQRRRHRDGHLRQRHHRDRHVAPGWCRAPRCRENVVTYEKQILTRDLPGSIIIAGAGAIGMEFAYVLKNYGVDVTIVEFLPRALPNEDAEVSKEIEKQYKKLGVKILTGTKVESIDDDGSTVTVTVSKDSKTEETQGRQGVAGHRFRAQCRGLRPGGRRRRAHRAQGHRHRRVHAHQRAGHLRHRRRHRASCSWRTSPRRRASSPPRPSPARRRWRWATTG